MELNEIKQYLRIEDNEEDSLISSLLFAAKSYIENGTGLTEDMIKDDSLLEIYKLCIKILVNNWYENRLSETVGPNFHKLSNSIEAMLLQLEAAYLKLKGED